jgi:hypothetical protein
MKSLYNHIQEGLLADIDTQLDKGSKEAEGIEMLESFKKWLTSQKTWRFEPGYIPGNPHYNYNTKRIDIDADFILNDVSGVIPKNVKIGEVASFSIYNQRIFNECKSQLPTKCNFFSAFNVNLRDFEITCEYVNLAKAELVNVILNIPETRSGLRQNYFPIRLGHRADVEELKINGHGGIIIDFNDTPVAETVIKKCKAYVNKLKRSGELKSAQDVNDAILKVIDDELSLSTIDKNWKGIMRIVFKDSARNFTMGNGIMVVSRLIKPGDLCIQRAPNETQWSVQQRIIKV